MTCLAFLGLELNSIAMEEHLPMDKLEYLKMHLREWQSQRCCNLRQIQELVGFLQFCTQVIPHGCTFVQGLINFSMTFQNKFSQRHTPAYAHSDISWWLSYMQSWNGFQILEPPKPVLHIYSDASSSKGLGGIIEDQWFTTRCPCCFCMR